MKRVSDLLYKMKSRRSDGGESQYTRMVLFSLAGVVILMLVASLSAFLLSLRGPEQTLVPDVRRRELPAALMELQDRELNPRIQMRVFSDPELRGKVVEQDPAAGTVVRAGRRVNLIVSEGPVVDRVDDFTGRSLEDVRVELQLLFTTFDAVKQIGAVSYVFDSSEPGTILEQSPLPGTEITGFTTVDLVVSRGPDVERRPLASFVGLSYDQAIRRLATENRPFVFTVAPATTTGLPGGVVSQEPAPGTEVAQNARVTLTIAPVTNPPEGRVFGIFERELPNYPVAVELTLDAVDLDGEREVIFAMRHPGGRLAVPYVLEPGTTLVLSRFNTEVLTYRVLRQD